MTYDTLHDFINKYLKMDCLLSKVIILDTPQDIEFDNAILRNNLDVLWQYRDYIVNNVQFSLSGLVLTIEKGNENAVYY